MRITLINIVVFLFIAFIGIALSSSSPVDNDDYAAANVDWNDLDTYYQAHLLNARAAKSRFWKRAPRRKFWKRSAAVLASTMNNADTVDSAHSQSQQH